MSKEIVIPDEFNEEEFISSFVHTPIKRAQPNTPPDSNAKEKKSTPVRQQTKEQKSKKDEYLSLFFNCNDTISPRMGKSITLDPSIHRKVVAVLQNIAKDDRMTLFNYVNNVLSHHFKEYKNEIIELYNNNTPFNDNE